MKGNKKMEINEIKLEEISNDDVIDIYNRTKEFIEFLEDEIKTNEVEK